MKCFNHNVRDAIGICKNCQRALCEDCLIISNGYISCKGECEAAISKDLSDKQVNNRVNAFALRYQFGLVMFFIIIGLLSSIYSVYLLLSGAEYSSFWGLIFGAIGGVFLLSGIISAIIIKNISIN